MASEEEEEIIPIPDRFEVGKYVLLYDPLDGSSNIDVNVSVGTIFGIYRRKTLEGRGTLEDCLQQGRNLVAAGYILYGASTMMVYATAGGGVHGFTLDPAIGEFLLSHPNLRFPDKPKYYSVNQGYQPYWSKGVQAYTDWLQADTPEKKGLSLRYIGSLVADFHRNLLTGGVFYYPADTKDPKKPGGKLRLLYEAAPLAFLARAGRRLCLRRHTGDPRHPAHEAAPARAALHRQPPARRKGRAVHHRAGPGESLTRAWLAPQVARQAGGALVVQCYTRNNKKHRAPSERPVFFLQRIRSWLTSSKCRLRRRQCADSARSTPAVSFVGLSWARSMTSCASSGSKLRSSRSSEISPGYWW